MELLSQILPLALLDTLSVATLAIPVWFLLTPGNLRVGNVLLYLSLVGGSYFLLGLLLVGVLERTRPLVRSALQSPAGDLGLAVAGCAFLSAALWHGFRKADTSRRGWIGRWREAAVGERAGTGVLSAVAVTAVVLEIATMFPYVIALGALADAGTPFSTNAAVLALYCLVMVAPALLATLVVALARTLVRPLLIRVDRWLRDNSQEDTAWLLAVIGFLLLHQTSYFDALMDRIGG
ncbi:Sap-like sulfolipid-1-addressing protein [Haloactinospora alba]|uniref:Sap-like sulfolipid-1-addressing protein n=1 Tax=Haloactinospora alba TaxID=405555 RepID=A0A543NES6_9ACTN|nr:GAP family protein [Haloactinospora alba]TQN30343.1 Sap-like sulfolipid-1-addressing protein [Haloactinospora alba]